MRNIGIWQINNGSPERLDRGSVLLEKHLEDWIEHDPSLLQSGLVVLGRQMTLEAGKLDLLALDVNGNWLVIEIKRGDIRRETIAQAIDYAACIDEMPFSELTLKVNKYLKQTGNNRTLESLLEERGIEEDSRNIILYVVGTGRDTGLERIAKFLSGNGRTINIVHYEVFENDNGQQVIVRELTELDSGLKTTLPRVAKPKQSEEQIHSIDALSRAADLNGIGQEFRTLVAASQKYDFFPRLYRHSIMYTPPINHTRMLFTIWATANRNKLMKTYIGTEVFAEFYSVSERDARKQLGESGWRYMGLSDVQKFVNGLNKLLG